ncbi:MAG: cold shock domain-containing protein [Proteobacteria bacterium]|nr:cold shock domain-containing protein [Pseudomonadota bacterium]MBU1714006.1 cold shock domain-containing protein [Pseudomonadota bacterium]
MELQVDGRNLEIRKSWQTKIEEERDRLGRHHPGLVLSLKITIEATSSHREGGYELRMVATVPNDTVVVKMKGEAVKPLLVKAFDKLGLQLKELQRKRRQTSKAVEGAGGPINGSGVIKSLSPFESYGFIVTGDGRDIYFHENALKDTGMDSLNEGDLVSFGESDGDKGPCAAWVKLSK